MRLQVHDGDSGDLQQASSPAHHSTAHEPEGIAITLGERNRMHVCDTQPVSCVAMSGQCMPYQDAPCGSFFSSPYRTSPRCSTCAGARARRCSRLRTCLCACMGCAQSAGPVYAACKTCAISVAAKCSIRTHEPLLVHTGVKVCGPSRFRSAVQRAA